MITGGEGLEKGFGMLGMRHLDLFCGIGGMTLALQGVSTPLMYCDSCVHAQAIVKKQMLAGTLPAAPIICDVRQVKAVAPVDIIAAGFPCTGFSTSGSMHGFKNESSALFFEMIRVCADTRPRLVFMENTPWIAQEANMQQVRAAFAHLQYSVKYCIMPAFAVGLPQVRYRWFAIATREPLQELSDMVVPPSDVPPPPPPPRSVLEEDKMAYRRYSLLRNALVPACARLALAYLLNPNNNLTSPRFVKPDLGLVMQDGPLTIRKKVWPTLHGHYARKGSRLTARCSYDIGTALMYEVQTLPGHVNIAFLEWLMGFPVGWTYTENMHSPGVLVARNPTRS